MKAAYYTGPKQLVIKDTELPTIGPNDVLIKIAYCGICGTDVHIFNGDGGAADVTPPLIIGHEFSGTVESIGSAVTRVKIGDQVSINPNDMCGKCYFCQNSMEHFCNNFTGIGTTINGGFAEYCSVNEKQAYKVNGIDLITAAMAEPLSCCIHGIDMCNIKPGSNVLIIGDGPIGLLMLQMARLSGAGKVIISAPIKEKRETALSLGADIAINPITDNVEQILSNVTNNIDTVIECVGLPNTIENAIEWAGKGATIMLFGLTGPDACVNIKPDLIFKKELTVTSSFINPYTYDRAIKLLESKRIDVKPLIKNIISLDELKEALETDTLRSKGKVMVKL